MMKRLALPLVFLLCAAALPAAAQPVYACPRYDGSTSYQDTPCVGMASGQQPVVNSPGGYVPGMYLKRAGEEAQAIILDAYREDIRSLGLSPECERAYLQGLSATVPEHCLFPASRPAQ